MSWRSGRSAKQRSSHCSSSPRNSAFRGAGRQRQVVPPVIDFARRQQSLRRSPEHPEPVPLRVARHVAEQPLQPVGDRLVIRRHGDEPVRGALEHGQVRGVFGDVRHELDRTGTGADHDDVLVGEVDVVVPPCGVERRPGEVVHAVDRRHVRPVQLADCRDHGTERRASIRPSGPSISRVHTSVVVRPRHRRHLVTETDVLADAELVRAGPEVVEQLRLGREVVRPVVALGERVAVHVVRHVDTAARDRCSRATCRRRRRSSRRSRTPRRPAAGDVPRGCPTSRLR